jgi:hypothetical protein
MAERAGFLEGVAEPKEIGGGDREEGKWREGGETGTRGRKRDRIITKRRTTTLFEKRSISKENIFHQSPYPFQELRGRFLQVALHQPNKFSILGRKRTDDIFIRTNQRKSPPRP